MAKRTTLATLSCNRCGHKWIRRIARRPKFCPNCHSPYYDKKRIRNVEEAPRCEVCGDKIEDYEEWMDKVCGNCV